MLTLSMILDWPATPVNRWISSPNRFWGVLRTAGQLTPDIQITKATRTYTITPVLDLHIAITRSTKVLIGTHPAIGIIIMPLLQNSYLLVQLHSLGWITGRGSHLQCHQTAKTSCPQGFRAEDLNTHDQSFQNFSGYLETRCAARQVLIEMQTCTETASSKPWRWLQPWRLNPYGWSQWTSSGLRSGFTLYYFLYEDAA